MPGLILETLRRSESFKARILGGARSRGQFQLKRGVDPRPWRYLDLDQVVWLEQSDWCPNLLVAFSRLHTELRDDRIGMIYSYIG